MPIPSTASLFAMIGGFSSSQTLINLGYQSKWSFATNPRAGKDAGKGNRPADSA
jgi:hypothetical protein